MWLLLILLGLITYFIVKRNVAGITRTPVWLVWLVMMTPALIWTAWFLVFGEDKPLPPLLFIGPFVLCPLVYWWLVQRGQTRADGQKTISEEQSGNLSETEKLEEASAKLRPITPTEEKSLRDCFPWGVYYLEHLDYRPQAILCRGKLRTNADAAYQTIKGNIEQVFSDRFLLLFQESFQGQPFFALVANPWTKAQQQANKNSEKITRPWLALGLLALTLMTTTIIGVELSGITPKALEENFSLLRQGLPYSLGLLTILGIHELSHYLTAIRYKIRTTLPYFIPVPFFLGTFGAFIQMRSPVPHRRALFDVAIAGPIGGFIMTIPLLIWGLSLSQVVPLTEKSSLFTFASLDPRFSFLFALLSKLALGNTLVPETALHLHPLAVAGYLGLIVTALNLMPVGQLDGGHIVHAMFGQRTAIIIGQLARICLLFLALIQPDFLLWAIILFLMPIADQPALNDVTELDNQRDLLGLFSLALLLSILLPLPGAVAQWLNF